MRLFIAILFNDEMKDALLKMQDDMSDRGVQGNFTPEDNMHLTLAFIGDYPDPEPVLLALERLGVQPSEAVLVGDTAFDILCGHNAGVDVVLVGWTLSVPEEMRVGSMKPEYVISKAEEMYSVLEI